MDDLIRRQDAIDAIEHRLAEPEYQHTGEDWYVGMNCAESEIYSLQPAQQWIPISERMPEEGKTVLGTFEFQDGKGCMTTERIIIKGKEIWSAACGMIPIAWMPLPEPYKENENEETHDIEKKYEAKVITRGNCMMCGKELTEGLFLCKECKAKAVQGK